VVVTQQLIEISPEFEGLGVNPNMGSSVCEFAARRRCRGAEHEFHVVNRAKSPDAAGG
jgi:hypothetical protein